MFDKTKHNHGPPDFDPDVSTRPSKRPRPNRLPEPDGFSTSEPKSKPKIAYKLPADMSFKSVFEDSKKSLPSKRGRTSRLVFPSDTFAAAGKLTSTPERDVSAVSGGSSEAKKRASVRPLKPPVFTTSTPPRLHQNHQRQTSSEPITFKRMLPPAFADFDASASTSKAQPESSKPPKPLRPPPPPILPSHKPQPELKHLPPPPPLPPPSTSKKGKEKETPQSQFRTISTTHIALSTDLTSQVGSATLLSIFLQQEQGRGNKLDVARGSMFGDGENGVEEEKEVRRGIGVSPVKGGGKGRGFVRNGLAERASNLLSRSQTAFTLWHKETSSQFPSATTARRPTADLHLRILKILHDSSSPSSHFHSRSTPTAQPIIALCRVLNKPQNSSIGAELTESDIYPVLFSSLSPMQAKSAREDIKEDKDVYVWKPWYTVELPDPGIFMDVGYEEGVDMQFGDEWVLRKSKRSREALLCSRFFVAVLPRSIL